MHTLDMMANPKITARLEPYKTVHSKPINAAADLSKLVIQNLTKPNIQNQITSRLMLTNANILQGNHSSLRISQSYTA